MNKAVQRVALSVLAAVMIGGQGAYAASIESDSLQGADQRIMVNVTTWAGSGDLGSGNGTGENVTFRIPSRLAILPDNTVLISDSRNHLIRKLTEGRVSPYAGVLYEMDDKGFPIGGLLDGQSGGSLFHEPQGMAVDADGNVYVADAGNHAIRKIDASGRVSTLAGSGLIGLTDGKGKAASFYRPMDVAVAADGTLYVADTLNHVIRSVSPSGEVRTLSEPSSRAVEVSPGQASPAGDFADGELNQAKFNEPGGLVIDDKGNLYVSDSGNQRIRYIDLQAGTVSTVAGGGAAAAKKELYVLGDYADGEASQARFNFPLGIAWAAEGGLIIADSQNHAIRFVSNGRVITLAGVPGSTTGELDGIEGSARMQRPTGVAVQADGSIIVADAFNNKLRQIRLYSLPVDLPKDNNVKVVLDNQWLPFEAPPEIVAGRTMVPVRAIAEALGYQVAFDDATRAVQFSKEGVTVEITMDRTGIKRIAEGREWLTETDAAPYIKHDLTYVPVRFFAEEIGLDVQWDHGTRTAILRHKTGATER
ncbi:MULTISPECIES: stalk domain-containing protein [unclassified Paenibacillus]|uniref:stalk domain-containing protein n=1 Tax=unclassified Paenibacillus TaxID=185978 RepID=UPI001AE51E93|nr:MULTISPECIES: stalk domain-containing protein [unclassified Paenibacillus]MBP1154787.1 sugar lactone lactonase YvrE [Paenibacillus sp. PvP091]MBP1169829.1 sugar lactone lactonase YvrE [Paenibacillus sp. PvR098]MBP2440857.1 sugar lactone lactonase YvrE [Paenibacillus sp. PvP052]